MQTLSSIINAIVPLDNVAMARTATRLNGLVKPTGSFGRLEHLAIQLAGMRGLSGHHIDRKQIIVMVADHGVYDEGVTISPKSATAIHAQNMMKGITGVCVLAENAGADVKVVDVGIDSDPVPGLVNMKVERGSGNIAQGPAMSRQQAEDLLLASACLTLEQITNGVQLFGVGELGMANTTPAAAVVSVFTDNDPQQIVGIGANFPSERLHHKVAVVRQAIEINRPDARDSIDVLAKVGGYDLVGMAGVMLGAASVGLPVILDGFPSYAAALAACRIAPDVRHYLIPSHLSAEKGSIIALQHLQLAPYLHLDMRLGEGSGAALAMHLVDAACAMYNNMGLLAESNIVLPF
ncbi:nicotinate-nucleotide--dimethylbenzimidazole phosphoribosyltransferase [Photorhabdus laumondii subsp. laumondii]|uniref:Nicotinate-nucleotide--dimethylbenzimidazole phosphoribosyltransferase n=2 Tax=Photorhabdus laumondii subsp. laumondii TaxID=141679 RepID=COBT_PHOLL|nr:MULTISPECIES: nicotinate-nucleotide--dimethylbenzimidazole phosphoribosyltransferase [Photorhabdus]Q7N2U4.1 RecName: Full=Nicotinate-nucleotide--dimethylbenzimidazole phosphoribosyltransferase; Short=NN:DBI PRT; AltName: Full=N(1)-alpha-phosphoribosyltransferase [Photorhabdus laumondii subsp. laumondii TTO1]AWK42687.1 nicotinate-nucleotide--dimethylbenzimidazole phosphoribosyltransferase [Photorhabdus laumondii subsp. laumondii]AXG43465.1 nicotinate-nucleotide--dimethylbenzimidazole phosphori